MAVENGGRSSGAVCAARDGPVPNSNGMRKAGTQEQIEDAMAQWKPDRNLRLLRLLLFQDQTCTMRPLFATMPIRLERKETKLTKSEIAA